MISMKSLLKTVVAGVLATGMLAGCSSGSTATASATEAAATAASATESAAASTEKKDVKLGFLAPTLQTEFFIGIDNDLKAGCDERGWGYTSVSFDNDSATAVSAIENMVTSGVNVLLAMISDKSCDDALKEAKAAGVTIIECGVVTDVYDIAINTDQYAIGEQIGKMASDWINSKKDGKANIVVYTTYQNTDMQNRGQGIQDAVKAGSPNATILEVVDIGKDVVGSGTTTTETMLQKYPELDTILCYGDAAATESVEAVKAAGRNSDDFGIFACDGTDAALKYIASNDVMRGTIHFTGVAQQTFDDYEAYLQGKDFSQPVFTDAVSVTADNVKDYLN